MGRGESRSVTDPNRLKQTVQDSELNPQNPLIGSLNLLVEQGYKINEKKCYSAKLKNSKEYISAQDR